MIKAKKLMIGNWVMYNDGTLPPMYVTGIFGNIVQLNFDGNDGDLIEADEIELFPIPLTDGILIKNGFSNMSAYYTNKEGNIYIRLGEHITARACITDSNSPTYSRVSAFNKIKHVHELQNLLTLAGIEMDIKI